jgi:hypothetical protein
MDAMTPRSGAPAPPAAPSAVSDAPTPQSMERPT